MPAVGPATAIDSRDGTRMTGRRQAEAWSMPEPTNSRWSSALSTYDRLAAHHWKHIPPFRELVAWISGTREAFGLTAFTSHETLIVSPYSRYPDWFYGRGVRLHP